MADQEHLKILKQGVKAWNEWRSDHQDVQLDFGGVSLRETNLVGVDLNIADLRHADLCGADLTRADLTAANLRGANLSKANLSVAELCHADLREANLSEADLNWANLFQANLDGASLVKANLRATLFILTELGTANLDEAEFGTPIFANVDLSRAKGLANCRHRAYSVVDHRTLKRSPNVPINFWRGCGLPDALIDYMPSLSGDALQFYSCFISYSSKDQEFADRLHADLQDNGVRCWFAPHDLPIGAKILDGIDDAIRLRDKVFLILSESAIASDWVEDEVTTAFEEERRRKGTMLFPIRLDDAVMKTGEAWASKLRARNIGDFTRWKEHDSYKATFERVLRDLRAER